MTRFGMGLALQGGVSKGGCPALGQLQLSWQAAAQGSLTACGIWWLRKGHQFQLHVWTPKGIIAQYPPVESPVVLVVSPAPPALDQCVLHFCYFPAAFCSRLDWAYPSDVWLSTHPDFSLPPGSPSNERLCFSLLGLYFTPLWLGAFCRQGTYHLCSEHKQAGVNYPHLSKQKFTAPQYLHTFSLVYTVNFLPAIPVY